ncbi:MAG: hypothetical protein QOH22_724 [Gemmatimonadaceae bacterium]|jgi:hypothetical protein|nr:hypothetical protein [Gemmatimonadaceae bacterium]
MAITYTISREERRINAFATGITRADDLHGLIKTLLADPAFVPGLRALYDARYAEPDITVLQLAEVAGEVKKLLDRGLGRIALVAHSETTYRVAKTFSIIARAIGVDVDVFKELAPAQSWLDESGDS